MLPTLLPLAMNFMQNHLDGINIYIMIFTIMSDVRFYAHMRINVVVPSIAVCLERKREKWKCYKIQMFDVLEVVELMLCVTEILPYQYEQSFKNFWRDPAILQIFHSEPFSHIYKAWLLRLHINGTKVLDNIISTREYFIGFSFFCDNLTSEKRTEEDLAVTVGMRCRTHFIQFLFAKTLLCSTVWNQLSTFFEFLF